MIDANALFLVRKLSTSGSQAGPDRSEENPLHKPTFPAQHLSTEHVRTGYVSATGVTTAEPSLHDTQIIDRSAFAHVENHRGESHRVENNGAENQNQRSSDEGPPKLRIMHQRPQNQKDRTPHRPAGLDFETEATTVTLSSLSNKFKAINRRYSRTISALADQIYRRGNPLEKSCENLLRPPSPEAFAQRETGWPEELKILEHLLEGEKALFSALEHFASQHSFQRRLFQILRRPTPCNLVFWDHSTLEFGYKENFHLQNGQRQHFEAYFARPAAIALQHWMLSHNSSELLHSGTSRRQQPLRNLLNYTNISGIIPNCSPDISFSHLVELLNRELSPGSRALIISHRAPYHTPCDEIPGIRDACRGSLSSSKNSIRSISKNVYTFNPTISASDWSETFEDVLYSLKSPDH